MARRAKSHHPDASDASTEAGDSEDGGASIWPDEDECQDSRPAVAQAEDFPETERFHAGDGTLLDGGRTLFNLQMKYEF